MVSSPFLKSYSPELEHDRQNAVSARRGRALRIFVPIVLMLEMFEMWVQSYLELSVKERSNMSNMLTHRVLYRIEIQIVCRLSIKRFVHENTCSGT